MGKRTCFSCTPRLLCACVLLAAARLVAAQSAVVGVNLTIEPYYLTPAQQEEILGHMQDAGVKVIRSGITGDDKGYSFAQRVYAHGIKIEWLVCVCSPTGHLTLSEADPATFRAYFQSRLSALESKGIVLAGLELGNEINWTNHDLGDQKSGTGRILGNDELINDPKGQQVAKGYLQYIKALAVMKDIRDHSSLNGHTPIISAGLSPWDPPSPAGSTGSNQDAVSLKATLQFLRANGMDQYLDGYGIHWYPQGTWSPAARRSFLQQLLSVCRADKPCWMTEWGIPVSSGSSCPVVDAKRTAIFSELRDDFKPYARQGLLAGLFLYEWEGDIRKQQQSPYGAYICGSLTLSGRQALEPL
jgi:hypothetical protein